MANKLEELKSALGAAARANKYRIMLGQNDDSTLDVLCKAAAFPSMTLGQIEVFNQGRKLIIPGDTAYTNSWTVTFYQTEDHAVRKAMIELMTLADNFQENVHAGNPNDVMFEMMVEQLDSNGEATATYKFHNAFVQEVGEIALADDPDAGAMEFDVTFSFTDWVVEG